ncbi:MAG: DUF4326 domain-containing protein [Acidobacteriota bacterium]
MHCTEVTVNGIVATVCGAKPRRARCYLCKRLCHYQLCDYVVDQEKGKTCNRKLCRGCGFHLPPDKDYCREPRPAINQVGSITVVNRRDSVEGIYIGRKVASLGIEGSMLGNPFKLGSAHATTNNNSDDEERETVIKQYRAWLWNEILERSSVWVELCRLRDMVLRGEDLKLVCWCAPKRCHGDIVKAALEWIIRKSLAL